MKIPADKKLIELDLMDLIPEGSCVSLLSFLKKNLPKGITLEDVVLAENYIEDSDPFATGHYELILGYLISKEVLDKTKRIKDIKKEQEELNKLEKRIKSKKEKLAKLRKE